MQNIDIRSVAVSFFAIMLSLTVHEFAHAIVADRLGDPTPRAHGRITLNPIVIMQAHPFGALIVPLIGAFSGFLVGWAATPVNPSKVDRKYSVRWANFAITAAGPISNLILAVIAAFLYVALSKSAAPGSIWEPLTSLAQFLVITNVFLALFNALPVPPLDGFTLITTLAPPAFNGVTRFIVENQLMVLIVVFMFAGRVLSPLVYGVYKALISLALVAIG
ncbi:site-2 protease family protein [Myxococcota bacterium]|nr:site-2 protease family protein [Myxococcota bacterium]MBU1432975.1 site-2 protease family protein [Myxococcota bacterium]MBU1897177.1 site-2 protease family protein [Myxococcota bacterium]